MDANFGVWAFCFIALSLVTQSEVWSQGLLVASAVRASLDCKGRVCPTHWAARDMVFHVVSARQIHSRVSGKLQSIQGAYIYIIYTHKYLHIYIYTYIYIHIYVYIHVVYHVAEFLQGIMKNLECDICFYHGVVY